MVLIKLKTLALFSVLAAMLLVPDAFAFPALTATSPDGNLSISFQLKANAPPYKPGARPFYAVRYQNAEVLTDAPPAIFVRVNIASVSKSPICLLMCFQQVMGVWRDILICHCMSLFFCWLTQNGSLASEISTA
ncbi:MAG: hypothetical protein ACRD3T_05700 [Terriglobia bacterium]